MKKKLHYFSGAFVIGVILLGMMCGFILVDIGADSYMPGRFSPILEINRVTETGVAFSFMGIAMGWSLSLLDDWAGEIYHYRGLYSGRGTAARQTVILMWDAVGDADILERFFPE